MEKRVLVVEDSTTMRSLIASTVEEIPGFTVIAVGNGFEALKTLPQQPIDLIITDINMPDINGLEIVNFVKNHPNYRTIPMIIVSTEQSEEDIQKGRYIAVDMNKMSFEEIDRLLRSKWPSKKINQKNRKSYD